MPGHGPTNVVVLNQHGDNRGDEAAMVAMVGALAARLPDARFTILDQFASPASRVDLPAPATYHPIRISPVEYARLVMFAFLRSLGRRVPGVLGRNGRPMVEAIEDADLVVSAPGGPYFGDLYADHELAHWLWVWLAHQADRPLGLYASSCGPFRNRLLNPVRRRGYRWFDVVVLRERHSGDMYRALTGSTPIITVDSAFQDQVPPRPRAAVAPGSASLVVVAVRDPGDAGRARHDDAVVAALDALAGERATSFVFIPQLHGGKHADAPYLRSIADRVTGAASCEVLAETTPAHEQRATIGAAEIVVAGRYHPGVFAIAAGVPPLVIAYEHKQTGLAEAAGIGDWVFAHDDLDAERLAAAACDLRRRGDEVRAILAESAPRLRALSATTSDLIAALVS